MLLRAAGSSVSSRRASAWAAGWLASFLLQAAATATAGTVSVAPLAMEGQPPPAGPAGAVFAGAVTPDFAVLNQPQINPAGQLMFQGGLVQGVAGVTSENDAVVFGPGSDGAMAIVLREGDRPPGLPFGARFQRFWALSLGAGGHVVARAASNLSDANDFAIFAPDASGRTALLAMEGKSAPGAPEGARFSGLGFPFVNALGQVAFRGSLEHGLGGIGDDDDFGIWGPDASGDLTLLLREGDPAPLDDPPGAVVDFVGVPADGFFPLIDDAGNLVTFGRIAAPGVGIDANDVIWASSTPGSFGRIAREGAAAPGAEPAVFEGFSAQFELNAGGAFVFGAHLRLGAGGVTADDNSGLWSATTGGALSLLLREGDPVPAGVPAGARMGDLSLADVHLNHRGEIAFSHNLRQGFGGVTAANDQAIFGPDTSGTPTVLARQGDVLAGGLLLESVFNVSLSERGDTAFEARLAVGSGGVDGGNNQLLLIAEPDGDLSIVVREDDVVEVAPGDFRTVLAIEQCCGWNELGRLVFALRFDDGTSGFFEGTLDDAPPLPPAAGPPAPPAGSVGALTQEQESCLKRSTLSVRRVARATMSEARSCLRDFNKARNGVVDPVVCTGTDRGGRIASASARALSDDAAWCVGSDAQGRPLRPPAFGRDAGIATAAAHTVLLGTLHAGYGADLLAAAIDEQTDRDASRCQEAAWKALVKCQDGALREFGRCALDAVEEGEDPFPLGANRAVDLEACVLADPAGKIERSCQLVARQVERKCTRKGVSLAMAFPQCASEDPEVVEGCLRTALACVTCAGLNEAYGLDVDCHFLDDGVADESCLTCRGRLPTVVVDESGTQEGTDGDDVIVVTTAGFGIVQAGDGDDLVCGGEGRDFLFGGPGNDWISGGPGDDGLLGEDGDDILVGGPGDDSCNGGPQIDSASECETLVDVP